MNVRLWACLLFLPFAAKAQQTPEQIAAYKIVSAEKVVPETGPDVYAVSAPYGEPELSAEQLKELEKRQIISVDLVYTRYRRSQDFDQKKLNLNRLQNLQRILPAPFADHKVDWQLIEQTGAKDYQTGQTYFHGFIIRTRKGRFTTKDRNEEIKALESDLKAFAATLPTTAGSGTSGTSVGTGIGTTGSSSKTSTSPKTGSSGKGRFRPRNPLLNYDSDPIKYYDVGPVFSSDPCELVDDALGHISYPKEAEVRNISGRVQVQFTVNRGGAVQDIKIVQGLGFGCDEAVKNYVKTMPRWTPARNKAGNVNAYVTLSFWFILDPAKAPTPELPCELIVLLPKGKAAARDSLQQSSHTTSVSEIFSRQPTWNNLAVVCDVTGSMGPYMSDMLKWYRLNAARIKHFTFFNDGDMTPDSRKAIGATGGLYRIPSTTYQAVETELYKAMRNGWGGDLPENDVEALLDAEKSAPFAERIIWVADNYSTPRDLSLLPKLKKPVSIIMCSARGGVNTDYLNIARQLNASIHTLSTDLPNVSNMKDGERVTIDERQYELINGKFVRIY